MILTDISFKHMWSTNISDKTKEAIWKYLQTFCLLAINYKSSQDLQSALSDLSDNKEVDIKDKNVASDVKKIKKMTENMQEPLPEPLPEPEGSNPLENMEQNPRKTPEKTQTTQSPSQSYKRRSIIIFLMFSMDIDVYTFLV